MRLSDGLKQRKSDLLDRLEAMSKKAADENREFDATETAAWDGAMREAKDLEQRIERQVAAEELQRGDQGGRLVAVDTEGRHHPILRTGDKLSDRYPLRAGQPQPDLAKIVVGLATGDFGMLKRDLGETIPGAGGYTVPTPLAAAWLDLMRARTVSIQLGAGTIDMTSETLKIAELTQDVVPTFRPENTTLNSTDMTFGQVLLRARLVGVIAKSSLELLADSPMAGDMITTSITQALALAADAAMLSGDGVVSGTVDNPLGILNDPNVNVITAVGAPTNYDHWLDAMEMIEAANMDPDGVVFNPIDNNKLRKLKNTLTDPMRMPDDFAAMPREVTTGLAAGNSIVADWDNSCLFGMRSGVTIEATRVGDTPMSKAQIWVRGYMRLDCVRTRPKGVTVLKAIA
jgi:HK97 family phage major capsid protein